MAIIQKVKRVMARKSGNTSEPHGKKTLDRREAMARRGVGAAAIYTAPVLLSLSEAKASSGGGSGGGSGGASGGSAGSAASAGSIASAASVSGASVAVASAASAGSTAFASVVMRKEGVP